MEARAETKTAEGRARVAEREIDPQRCWLRHRWKPWGTPEIMQKEIVYWLNGKVISRTPCAETRQARACRRCLKVQTRRILP